MRHVLAVHQGLEPGDHVGVLRGDVGGLRRIHRQVEELGRLGPLRLLGAGRPPHRLPAAIGHRLPLPFGELAIEKPACRCRRLPLERRREAHAVAPGGDLVMKTG